MSKIEWTDSTWNPVTGCTKVSPGCKHCYAETFAERFRGVVGHPYEQGFDLRLWPDRLDQPLRWRKPRRVFVNSMSDLFHEQVPNLFIAKVFDVMAKAKQHVFQVLTKRPERMRDFVTIIGNAAGCDSAPPNVWLGVSAEDQATADARIPVLLDTPAAVRFLSAEPLLGPMDLGYTFRREYVAAGGRPCCDWVIVGGESGPGARPCNVAWVRSILRQCRQAGVAAFCKQLGGHVIDHGATEIATHFPAEQCWPDVVCARMNAGPPESRIRLDDRKGGDIDEWPEDLRVREWPG